MLSSVLPSQDLKAPNNSDETNSTKLTEASNKEQDTSFDTNPPEENEMATLRSMSQESITIKIHLLARTGNDISRVSLLSNYTPRHSEAWSYRQSISSQLEESKFCGFIPKIAHVPMVKAKSFVEEFWRPDSEIREDYFSRLKSQQVMGLRPKKKHQTLVIMDWDGALFCGSDLEEIKSSKRSEPDSDILKSLDETLSMLLTKVTEYCSPFIITSYDESLVESRSRIFLPMTFQVIMKNKVKIISTSHYVHTHNNRSWQTLLFSAEKYEKNVGTNIMCMVDSQTKIDMISVLAGHFEKPLVKIVKFKEYSKVREVIKQQKLLIREFENILFSLRSFTVQLAKKIAKK